MTSRVRAQADLAAASARDNATLAGFLHRLSGLADPAEAARVICEDIALLFEVQAVLLTPSPAGLAVQAATKPDYRLETMEMAAAHWAFDTGTPAGKGSATLAASEWLFQPLKAGNRTLAVLGLAREAGASRCAPTACRC